jgi:hypothetical protein
MKIQEQQPRSHGHQPRVEVLKNDSLTDSLESMRRSIALRAQELFEAHGRQGHDIEDWLRAESEIVEVLRVQPTFLADTLGFARTCRDCTTVRSASGLNHRS